MQYDAHPHASTCTHMHAHASTCIHMHPHAMGMFGSVCSSTSKQASKQANQNKCSRHILNCGSCVYIGQPHRSPKEGWISARRCGGVKCFVRIDSLVSTAIPALPHYTRCHNTRVTVQFVPSTMRRLELMTLQIQLRWTSL
jgi:hypothetical protein